MVSEGCSSRKRHSQQIQVGQRVFPTHHSGSRACAAIGKTKRVFRRLARSRSFFAARTLIRITASVTVRGKKESYPHVSQILISFFSFAACAPTSACARADPFPSADARKRASAHYSLLHDRVL